MSSRKPKVQPLCPLQRCPKLGESFPRSPKTGVGWRAASVGEAICWGSRHCMGFSSYMALGKSCL